MKKMLFWISLIGIGCLSGTAIAEEEKETTSEGSKWYMDVDTEGENKCVFFHSRVTIFVAMLCGDSVTPHNIWLLRRTMDVLHKDSMLQIPDGTDGGDDVSFNHGIFGPNLHTNCSLSMNGWCLALHR